MNSYWHSKKNQTQTKTKLWNTIQIPVEDAGNQFIILKLVNKNEEPSNYPASPIRFISLGNKYTRMEKDSLYVFSLLNEELEHHSFFKTSISCRCEPGFLNFSNTNHSAVGWWWWGHARWWQGWGGGMGQRTVSCTVWWLPTSFASTYQIQETSNTPPVLNKMFPDTTKCLGVCEGRGYKNYPCLTNSNL